MNSRNSLKSISLNDLEKNTFKRAKAKDAKSFNMFQGLIRVALANTHCIMNIARTRSQSDMPLAPVASVSPVSSFQFSASMGNHWRMNCSLRCGRHLTSHMLKCLSRIDLKSPLKQSPSWSSALCATVTSCHPAGFHDNISQKLNSTGQVVLPHQGMLFKQKPLHSRLF